MEYLAKKLQENGNELLRFPLCIQKDIVKLQGYYSFTILRQTYDTDIISVQCTLCKFFFKKYFI